MWHKYAQNGLIVDEIGKIARKKGYYLFDIAG
jgi:hypothetical protein